MFERPRVDRALTVAAFALLAGAPFVLTMCSPERPPPAAPIVAIATASSSAQPMASTPDSTSEASAAAASESHATPPPPEPPPYKGALPGTCAAIESMIHTLAGQRSCRSDGDCTNFAQNCACHQAVSQAVAPKLRALEDAMRQKDCYRRGPPRPCATCPPPRERHCITGACE